MILDIEPLDGKALWSFLLRMSETYASVTININEYCKLLTHPIDEMDEFIPITQVAVLRTGLYAHANKMEIRCSKEAKPGQLLVGDIAVGIV